MHDTSRLSPVAHPDLPSAAQLWGTKGDARDPAEFDPLEALVRPGLQDLHAPRALHTGLLCALLAGREGPLVWVQDALAAREFGHPSVRGLAAGGVVPDRIIGIRARRPQDALWAMEEAAKAGVDVVGELEGCPRALDFTATRRLDLFAREAGASCLLARLGERTRRVRETDSFAARVEPPSGAPFRWRVDGAASAPDPHDPRAPGATRWHLTLVRARAHPPRRWVVERMGAPVERDLEHAKSDTGAAHRLRLVSPLAAGNVAAGETADGTRIVPFPAGGSVRVA